jgi:hypothetical protein
VLDWLDWLNCDEHVAAVPRDPRQVHVATPDAVETLDAVPDWHVPVLEPHTEELNVAEHDEGLPPLDPAQVHVHGPLPFTVGVEPSLHKFEVGAEDADVPLAEPHEPSASSAPVRIRMK